MFYLMRHRRPLRSAKTPLRLLNFLCAPLLLCACGFQAVGSRALPVQLEKVHVDMVTPYRVAEPQVESHMRSLLAQRGAQVLDRSDADTAVIQLSNLRQTREVRTVGPDGKALEYDLILRVDFIVRWQGIVYVPSQQMEVRRDYSFNPGQLLAKEQEAMRLREYLENEMAELILLKIETLMRKGPPPAPVQDEVRVVPLLDYSSALTLRQGA